MVIQFLVKIFSIKFYELGSAVFEFLRPGGQMNGAGLIDAP